jgi:hypothetical protein
MALAGRPILGQAARSISIEPCRAHWALASTASTLPAKQRNVRVEHRRRIISDVDLAVGALSMSVQQTFRVPRAQFVLFLEQFPQAKEQNLYTRWLLRSRAYLAARLFRASARW